MRVHIGAPPAMFAIGTLPRRSERFVVVVSAQEGVTDRLAATARQVVSQPNPAALDLLWSTGELRSVALLALHLQALGVSAAALNIHEAGLAW